MSNTTAVWSLSASKEKKLSWLIDIMTGLERFIFNFILFSLLYVCVCVLAGGRAYAYESERGPFLNMQMIISRRRYQMHLFDMVRCCCCCCCTEEPPEREREREIGSCVYLLSRVRVCNTFTLGIWIIPTSRYSSVETLGFLHRRACHDHIEGERELLPSTHTHGGSSRRPGLSHVSLFSPSSSKVSQCCTRARSNPQLVQHSYTELMVDGRHTHTT